MSEQQMAIKIRTKKLGVLLRDARLFAQKDSQDCASFLGVPVARFEAYEVGERSPSLPELESLAYYFDIPLQHFWGNSLLSVAGVEQVQPDIQYSISLRTRIIGASIRKARSDQAISLEAMAEMAGISPAELEKYELAVQPLPVPVLETISIALGKPVDDFLDQNGPVGARLAERQMTDAFLNLPPNLQAFLSKPVNKPYLELAVRLSGMSVERLRAVAEGLLEITL